jgi:hypothetical protein
MEGWRDGRREEGDLLRLLPAQLTLRRRGVVMSIRGAVVRERSLARAGARAVAWRLLRRRAVVAE